MLRLLRYWIERVYGAKAAVVYSRRPRDGLLSPRPRDSGRGRFTLRGPRIILEGRVGVREGPQSFIDIARVNTWMLLILLGD